MGFFDSISRAIGTDGSGQGALVELGRPLGFRNSSEGLFNNPGVKEAAAVAAIAYGVPAGFEYFAGANAGGAAGTAGAFANAGVLGSTSVGIDLAAVGSSAISALNTGAQIVGGINAIKSLTGGTGSKPVSSGNASNYYLGLDGSNTGKPNAAQAGEKGGNAPTPVIVSSGSPESTLTKLAAGLTVAAIIYQFSRGK